MPAPEIIHQLVQQFTDNRDAYRSGRYNEAQLRQEFLNPFFEALGWDVSNRKGYSINYREVVHEDSIHIKGSPHAKAPDYAFRLGGVRKFFVEAKKPAEDIQFDRELAYQLKVYAWNVGLPVSILTDFEEFAVYDCRNKPNPSDSPAAARILYLRYDQYIEKWDEIAGIFSPLAIQKGAFDRYVADTSSKRGTTRVDDAFLADIEEWRTLLARNIALRNQHVVNERQLNYAVQMTIDRIIFLRICEDRGIEPANQLLEISKSKGIYPQMVQLYQRADLKYNSGLFHFKSEKGESNHADKFTPSLEIDDRVLKEIIKDLYYPCPYIFKEIPVEILGQVYEQFLGKVIRLTPGRQAKIEEKPEVRKAGGVYYTPSYIVDYIVANTVGKLVEDKTPEQVSQLRVVDPACGSGSFLLGAFQYLLDWHEGWYLQHDPQKWAKGKLPALIPTEGGGWKLTTAEKKRILVNNIYGVDIDAQAVEVTKLSLLLKVLEEESGQLSLGLERVLPDLGDNIKCGNSLIGWDYFEGQLIPDEKELERVNPFDWQRNFPHVFARGGFDAVIGNPPYLRIQALREWANSDVEFYKRKYISANKGNYDIYVIFIEKGLTLINENGKLGLILPHKFFQAQFAQPIRHLIEKGKNIEQIIHFGSEQVFANATTYTCLLFLSKQPKEYFDFVSVSNIESPKIVLSSILQNVSHQNYKKALLIAPNGEKNEWHFFANESKVVLDKLYLQNKTLADVTNKIFQGIATSADNIYVLKVKNSTENTYNCYSKSLDVDVEIEKEMVRPFLMGKDVHRYNPLNPENVVIFPYDISKIKPTLMSQDYIRKKFPLCWKYLLANKKNLSERERGRMYGDNFYAYIYPKNLVDFDAVKIVSREISLGCQMTIDDKGIIYHTTKVYSFVFKESQVEDIKFWLGLLNSNLLWFFIKSTGYTLRGGYYTFKTNYLNPFPVVTLDFTNSKDIEQHDRMVALVERMLELHKRDPQTPQEANRIQREIAATDTAIDKLVYELYGLTEEEVRIVEGGAS